MKKLILGASLAIALISMNAYSSFAIYTIRGKAKLIPKTMTTSVLKCPDDGFCATVYDNGEIYIYDYDVRGFLLGIAGLHLSDDGQTATINSAEVEFK